MSEIRNEETEYHDVQYCYHVSCKRKKKLKIVILMFHVQLDRAHPRLLSLVSHSFASLFLCFFFSLFSDDPLHKNCLVSNIFSMENGMNTTNQDELISALLSAICIDSMGKLSENNVHIQMLYITNWQTLYAFMHFHIYNSNFCHSS